MRQNFDLQLAGSKKPGIADLNRRVERNAAVTVGSQRGDRQYFYCGGLRGNGDRAGRQAGDLKLIVSARSRREVHPIGNSRVGHKVRIQFIIEHGSEVAGDTHQVRKHSPRVNVDDRVKTASGGKDAYRAVGGRSPGPPNSIVDAGLSSARGWLFRFRCGSDVISLAKAHELASVGKIVVGGRSE